MPADTIVPSPIGPCSVLHADEIELAKIGRTRPLFPVWGHSKTGNPIADNLEPEVPEFRFEDHGLRIRSYDPSGLKFIVRLFPFRHESRTTCSGEARVGSPGFHAPSHNFTAFSPHLFAYT